MLLRYQLWDTNQKPVYQKCADKFEQANPDIKIQIENKNWGDYWSGLARGFIAETAPDVFTDHLGKYPQFAQSEVIEPVSTRGVDMNQYLPGLAELWKSPDGKQYGFPKDWDTVALIVNEDMLAKAGVTKQQLDTATWNPADGGSFEQIVAKLTVDNNGKRGDEPGFDPSNVKTYGLGFDPGGLTYGQTTWAGFAASLGFKLLDKNPWGTKYNYDDPRFAQTFTWWRNMIRKGYMPSLEQARTLGQSAAFQSGKAALAIDGDWTIGTYSATKGIKVGYAPQPAGPKGSGACTTGSRTRSGSAPSTRPRRPSGSTSWPRKDCQSIVGTEAVVFPAIKSEVPKAVAKHKENGHRRERVHVLHRVRQHGALPDHRQGAADQPDRAADARGVPQRRRGRREGVQGHERAGQQPAQVQPVTVLTAHAASRWRASSRPSPPPLAGASAVTPFTRRPRPRPRAALPPLARRLPRGDRRAHAPPRRGTSWPCSSCRSCCS